MLVFCMPNTQSPYGSKYHFQGYTSTLLLHNKIKTQFLPLFVLQNHPMLTGHFSNTMQMLPFFMKNRPILGPKKG